MLFIIVKLVNDLEKLCIVIIYVISKFLQMIGKLCIVIIYVISKFLQMILNNFSIFFNYHAQSY